MKKLLLLFVVVILCVSSVSAHDGCDLSNYRGSCKVAFTRVEEYGSLREVGTGVYCGDCIKVKDGYALIATSACLGTGAGIICDHGLTHYTVSNSTSGGGGGGSVRKL